MNHFRSSDGIRLAYEVDDFTDPWRQPQTLILLHSAMGCAARFFAWVPRLSRHYSVARLDLRGHGESEVPPPERPLTLSRLVSDVIEFMDEINCEHAHFVGASAGGYLAQRLAMDYPEKVSSLCLFGSTPGLKRSQGKIWLPQIKAKGLRNFLAETITDRFPIGQVDPGLVQWFLDQTGRNDPDYIVRFITLMTEQDWSDELGRIRCPTLVVIPGLGRIGDNAAYEPMKQRIKDITVKTYDNMPHNLWDIVPNRCVDDVLAFLDTKFGREGGRTEGGLTGIEREGERLVVSDGLTLRYYVDDFTDPWKTPETLILVHAAMGSARRLYAWVPHLCRDFRVVRLDMRGHGKSAVPGKDQLSLERLSQDVVDLLDHLGVERAHLAGSSAGGIVCMYTAIVRSERVRTLAAYAAIPGLKMSAGHTDYGAWIKGIREDGVRAFLKRTIGDRFDLDQCDPAFIEWFLDEAARNDPDLLIRFVALMSSVDFVDRVGEIRCPTLMVVPGADPNQSMEEYHAVRDALRTCDFVVYEGYRHNITDAVPDRCAEDLRAFLSRHRKKAR